MPCKKTTCLAGVDRKNKAHIACQSSCVLPAILIMANKATFRPIIEVFFDRLSCCVEFLLVNAAEHFWPMGRAESFLGTNHGAGALDPVDPALWSGPHQSSLPLDNNAR